MPSNLEKISNIAAQLDCRTVYDQLSQRLDLLKCDNIQITVTGSENTGKSTLLNALLGTSLKVSAFADENKARIVYTGYNATPEDIVIDNAWAKDHKFVFNEVNNLVSIDKIKPIDYGLHFAHTDVCVFLINAQAPFTKSDKEALEALNYLGIPTLLLIAKCDQLIETDFNDVITFVASKLKKLTVVTLCVPDTPQPLDSIALQVKDWLDTVSDKLANGGSLRKGLANLFYIEAISQLFVACQKKIETIPQRIQIADANHKKKIDSLSDLSTKWLEINNMLMDRKSDTIAKIDSAMAKNREIIIRQLSHGVEMCNDPKLYLEKELSYRLEDAMRINAQTGTQIINNDIANTIKWLNVEIKKSFNHTINYLNPISCSIESSSVKTNNIEVTDTKKIRLVARVGTAATVVAAGAMCATMGIGGVVMAVSMIAGIGADYFLGKKTDDAKAKIIESIPVVVDQAQLKMSINTSDNLTKLYVDLINQLQSCEGQWEVEAKKQIDKEHAITIHNIKVDENKLIACMNQINELSEAYV